MSLFPRINSTRTHVPGIEKYLRRPNSRTRRNSVLAGAAGPRAGLSLFAATLLVGSTTLVPYYPHRRLSCEWGNSCSNRQNSQSKKIRGPERWSRGERSRYGLLNKANSQPDLQTLLLVYTNALVPQPPGCLLSGLCFTYSVWEWVAAYSSDHKWLRAASGC